MKPNQIAFLRNRIEKLTSLARAMERFTKGKKMTSEQEDKLGDVYVQRSDALEQLRAVGIIVNPETL